MLSALASLWGGCGHTLWWCLGGFFGTHEPRCVCCMGRLFFHFEIKTAGKNYQVGSSHFGFLCLIAYIKLRSWYESCRIPRQNDRSHPPSSRSDQSITVSLQRMPNDSQNMQHARQPVDSDAEVVVQYLTKRLVKRKVCSRTSGKHL